MCAFRIRKLSALFIIVLLSASFTQAAFASYDFNLVFLGKKEYEQWWAPSLLEIRDGRFEYGDYLTNHPLWKNEITMSGMYFPRDNIMSGSFSIKYLNKTGYMFMEEHGNFHTSPIEGEKITIYFHNVKVDIWDPGPYYGTTKDYTDYEFTFYKVVWLSKPPQLEEPQYEDSGARFSGLSGEVEIWHYDEEREDARVAKLDMVIYVGDHVRTEESSSAIISFMDMTTFTMKPETEIVIPSPAAKENILKLLVGRLLANIKSTIKYGTLDVEMGEAVSGTKGTIFVAEERNGISRLKVIEGEVEFRSKSTGETQIVKVGEQIYADKSGLGPKTTFNIEEELKSWEYWEKQMQGAQPSGQEGITQSANQIIQIALPMIQTNLPIILIILALLFIITLAKRRSKRK